MTKQRQIKILRTEVVDITNVMTDDNKSDVLETMRQYAKSYKTFGEIICSEKSTDMNIINGLGYRKVTSALPNMPTAVVQASARHVAANIKSYNSNVKNINKGRKRHNKKCQEYNKTHPIEEGSNLQPMKEKPLLEQWGIVPSLKGSMYTLNTCACTVTSCSLTFSTINKRVKVPYKTVKWFDEKYPNRRFYSARITVDKSQKHFRIFITYVVNTVEEPSFKNLNRDNIVGVDRGIYHPIATSTGILESSKQIHAVNRRIAYAKKTARQHSSSSARRRVRALTRREVRFNNNVCNIFANEITSIPNVECVVVEDLTGIAKNTRDKRMSPMFRKWTKDWRTAMLGNKIRERCEAKGILYKEISPYNTSRQCSVCGHVDKSNRKGNKFKCPLCGHEEHADLNASKNIRDRYVDNLSNYLRVHSTTPIPSESSVQ